MNLVFIGGCPRSGTTLLQSLLDNHSEVYGGPEFDFIPRFMHLYNDMKAGYELGRQKFYYNLPELRSNWRAFVESFLNTKATTQNVKTLSEKTPDNVLVFKDIIEVFPEAKFIFIVRDPRAVILSFMKVKEKDLKNGMNRVLGMGENLGEDIHKYERYVRLGWDFYTKNKDQCHLIYYEDLVTNPSHEMRRVCLFLNLIYEDQMLRPNPHNDFAKLAALGNHSEHPFITKLFNKDISKDSLELWKSELSAAYIQQINSYFSDNPFGAVARYSFKN